jgi:hypothetical protein
LTGRPRNYAARRPPNAARLPSHTYWAPDATTVTSTIANSTSNQRPPGSQPAATAHAKLEECVDLGQPGRLDAQASPHQPIGDGAADDDHVAQHDRDGEPQRYELMPREEHGGAEHVELVGDRIEQRAETRHEAELPRQEAVGQVAQRRHEEHDEGVRVRATRDAIGDHRHQRQPEKREQVRQVAHAPF